MFSPWLMALINGSESLLHWISMMSVELDAIPVDVKNAYRLKKLKQYKWL